MTSPSKLWGQPDSWRVVLLNELGHTPSARSAATKSLCSSLPSGPRLPSALPRYRLSGPLLPRKPCSLSTTIDLMQLLTSSLLFPLRYGTLY